MNAGLGAARHPLADTGAMSRQEFPRKMMLAAFERCDGRCEGLGCGAKLTVGKYHFDHVTPDALGGKPTLSNCQVLCWACHADKTRDDRARLAKADRQRAAHLGFRARGKRVVPGSKASGWKHKADGSWVRR